MSSGRVAACILFCGAMSCSHVASDREQPSEVVSYSTEMTIAVAPTLNFSGSSSFDPIKVADLMASELASIPGIGIIGVNRLLAILAEQGLDQIQSPEHALEVCDRLGADRILVFAITEYDPYVPVVGMAAQLYGKRPSGRSLDPVAASRMARPFPVSSQSEENRPWAQAQIVFNAKHDAVQRDVRRYADTRGVDDSPHGWRMYLASQEMFLRYCSFTIVRELMQGPVEHDVVAERAVAERTATEEYGS